MLKQLKPQTEEINSAANDSGEQVSFFSNMHKHLHTLANNKRKLKMVLIIVSIIMFLFISIGIFFHQKKSVTSFVTLENHRSEKVLRELTDISSELQRVVQNPNLSSNHQSAIQAIQKDIADIQKSFIEVAKSTDIEKISEQLIAVKEDVDVQMNEVKKSVSAGIGSKQFVDSNILPFHVISIDVIAQQPYVTVDYSNHIIPLATGESLAGWKIISADYDSGGVELSNDKDQFIKINLQG